MSAVLVCLPSHMVKLPAGAWLVGLHAAPPGLHAFTSGEFQKAALPHGMLSLDSSNGASALEHLYACGHTLVIITPCLLG